MSNETIGVVIGAYNAESTLNYALASIAGQSLPPTQVVLVDDCSTDGTQKIAERWSRHLPLSVLRHDSNRGLGAARRTGIEQLSTDLIAILDADDYWLSDHLQTLHARYVLSPGIVCANALRWVEGQFLNLEPWQVERPVPTGKDQLSELFLRNFVFIGCLFSRLSYNAAGGSDAQLRKLEDWDLWLRMVASGASVSGVSHATVIYRLSEGSLTAAADFSEFQIQILEKNAGLATTVSQKRTLARSLVRTNAAAALQASYGEARNGAFTTARVRAFQALRGSRAIKKRALGMALAPKQTVALRDRKRNDPEWRVSN